MIKPNQTAIKLYM